MTIKELCIKYSRSNTYNTLNQLKAIEERLKIKIFEKEAIVSDVTKLPMFKLEFYVEIEIEEELGLILLKS